MAENEQPQDAVPWWRKLLRQVLIMLAIRFVASRFFSSGSSGSNKVVSSNADGSDNGLEEVGSDIQNLMSTVYPAWSPNDIVDVRLFANSHSDFHVSQIADSAELFVVRSAPLGALGEMSMPAHTVSIEYKNLGYTHLYAKRRSDGDFFVVSQELLVDGPPKKKKEKVNLLTEETPTLQSDLSILKNGVFGSLFQMAFDTDEETEEMDWEWDEKSGRVAKYLPPQIDIRFVADSSFAALPLTQLPAGLQNRIVRKQDRFYPVMFTDNFWHMRRKFRMIDLEADTLTDVETDGETDDETGVRTVQIDVSFSPLRGIFAILQAQLETQWQSSELLQRFSTLLEETMGDVNENKEGSEKVPRRFNWKYEEAQRRSVVEANLPVLVVSVVASLLHALFEFLAFKEDVKFWKQKQGTVGVSVRSLGASAAMQLIILLYLAANDSNIVVLLSSVAGLGVDLWKLWKCMRHTPESQEEQRSDRYDREFSRKLLIFVLIPLVLARAAYSLRYETHTSWYMFVLETLVSSVYLFGFLQMAPQVYLNYRLRSVAHMPGKQLMYKFLNTIVDDLFAFAVKMPTLHRLSVFRDDIIFVIFLYQRWAYKTDYTRVNEFGYQHKSDSEETESETAAATQATESETPQVATIQEPKDGAERKLKQD
ncbi:MAG: hypothetical protein MHM6MM_002493 [Cercozoa sp. M6MM]